MIIGVFLRAVCECASAQLRQHRRKRVRRVCLRMNQLTSNHSTCHEWELNSAFLYLFIKSYSKHWTMPKQNSARAQAARGMTIIVVQRLIVTMIDWIKKVWVDWMIHDQSSRLFDRCTQRQSASVHSEGESNSAIKRNIDVRGVRGVCEWVWSHYIMQCALIVSVL